MQLLRQLCCGWSCVLLLERPSLASLLLLNTLPYVILHWRNVARDMKETPTPIISFQPIPFRLILERHRAYTRPRRGQCPSACPMPFLGAWVKLGAGDVYIPSSPAHTPPRAHTHTGRQSHHSGSVLHAGTIWHVRPCAISKNHGCPFIIHKSMSFSLR